MIHRRNSPRSIKAANKKFSRHLHTMRCDTRQPAKEQLKHRRLYKAIAICQLFQQDFPAAFDTGFKNLGQCVSFLIHQPSPTPTPTPSSSPTASPSPTPSLTPALPTTDRHHRSHRHLRPNCRHRIHHPLLSLVSLASPRRRDRRLRCHHRSLPAPELRFPIWHRCQPGSASPTNQAWSSPRGLGQRTRQHRIKTTRAHPTVP